MKTRHVLNVASLLSALCLGQGLMAGTLDLAGDWQVQLQPAWNEAAPMHKLHLPGSLQAQGLGEEISVNTKWIGEVLDRSWYTAARYEKYRQPGNVKIPFWLQPDRHFVGAAIYRRMIGIPQDWAGKRVCLSLERVHISSKVWLDGKEIGTGNSLSTPHRFDLGKLAPGTHKLEIGIDNGMPALVGENSHCVSDQMQTDWNGIVGKLPPRDLPLGQSSLGKIEIPLAGLPTPSRLKFVIGIADTVIENHWDIWVYPASTPRPTAGAIVITRNPAEAWQKVADGAAVLLIPSVKSIVDPEGPKVALGFSTIFWNSAWAKNQPPNTLGILCDPKHPAFAGFPTDFHSNYQWWYLIQLASKPLCLDGQAPGLRPIVQVIDDWFTAHRLGLVVEAKCGKGKLLVCAIDVENAKPDDIVAAQFRASLLGYMNSAAFAPKQALDAAAFAKIIKPEDQVKYSVRADCEAPGYPAENVIDGDPKTCWHTPWEGNAPKFPHELVIGLHPLSVVTGCRFLPRQDMANGRIKEYALYASVDGKEWGQPVAQGEFKNNDERQTVDFQPVQASHLKFVALSAYNPQLPFAALAEIEVIVGPMKFNAKDR